MYSTDLFRHSFSCASYNLVSLMIIINTALSSDSSVRSLTDFMDCSYLGQAISDVLEITPEQLHTTTIYRMDPPQSFGK